MLKLPVVGFSANLADYQSQTFPEGKGVETAKSWLGEFERHSGRRPSQKVKVLKLARAVKHEVL